MTTINDLVDDAIIEIHKHLINRFNKSALLECSWAAFKLVNKRMFALCKPPLPLDEMVKLYQFNIFGTEVEELILDLHYHKIELINYMYGGLVFNSTRESSCILFMAIKYQKISSIHDIINKFGKKLSCDVVDLRFLITSSQEATGKVPLQIMLIIDYIRDDAKCGYRYLNDYDIEEYTSFANDLYLSKKFVADYIAKYSYPGITYKAHLMPNDVSCEVTIHERECDISFGDIRLAAAGKLDMYLATYTPHINGNYIDMNKLVSNYGITPGSTIKFIDT